MFLFVAYQWNETIETCRAFLLVLSYISTSCEGTTEQTLKKSTKPKALTLVEHIDVTTNLNEAAMDSNFFGRRSSHSPYHEIDHHTEGSFSNGKSPCFWTGCRSSLIPRYLIYVQCFQDSRATHDVDKKVVSRRRRSMGSTCIMTSWWGGFCTVEWNSGASERSVVQEMDCLFPQIVLFKSVTHSSWMQHLLRFIALQCNAMPLNVTMCRRRHRPPVISDIQVNFSHRLLLVRSVTWHSSLRPPVSSHLDSPSEWRVLTVYFLTYVPSSERRIIKT